MWTIYHPAQPHDIIKIQSFTKHSIAKKTAKLYTEGLSLRAIATELNVSKTAVRANLLRAGIPLRTHSNNQLITSPLPKLRSVKTAPYGYCLVKGKLLEDPREMANVRLMISWWNQGQSLGAIARRLNDQKIKPRKATHWSQPTVGFIIQRQKQKK